MKRLRIPVIPFSKKNCPVTPTFLKTLTNPCDYVDLLLRSRRRIKPRDCSRPRAVRPHGIAEDVDVGAFRQRIRHTQRAGLPVHRGVRRHAAVVAVRVDVGCTEQDRRRDCHVSEVS